MALILLLVIGASGGWLASIVARTETAREILRQMGVGIAASVVAGMLVNSNTVLGGLTLPALLASVATSAAALVGYNLLVRRSIEI